MKNRHFSPTEFRAYAHQCVDWMADYLENIEHFPVKAPAKPGEIREQLPASAPQQGESFEQIFEDFKNIILPGMTHWQHPQFFAYFPANASPPSILAEMLSSTLAAQCMSWQTSPAATELESQMMQWLRDILGLPKSLNGVIQDTASTATLCAILTAREQASSFQSNQTGLSDTPKAIVYCSLEAHSSVDKAVKIAGLGSEQLRKIDVNKDFSMNPEALANAIQTDIQHGHKPICVIATLGTTGVGAIDSIKNIGKVCRQHQLYFHIDAAWAGSALVLPEYRWMLDGAEMIDSFVCNPHKWLLTQFDCSAYFVKDTQALLKTFAILPEYLKTDEDQQVNNYRDWGIPLGRRFRALKLWFVMRSYGVCGLQAHIQNHIQLAQSLAEQIAQEPCFELMAPTQLGLVCFRYKPEDDHITDEQINRLNQSLLETLNNSGKLYLTHTQINNTYTLRMAIGGVYTQQQHINQAWQAIKAAAALSDQ